MKVTVTYEEGSGSVSITKNGTDFTWLFDNNCHLTELTDFAVALNRAGWPESDEVPYSPHGRMAPEEPTNG